MHLSHDVSFCLCFSRAPAFCVGRPKVLAGNIDMQNVMRMTGRRNFDEIVLAKRDVSLLRAVKVLRELLTQKIHGPVRRLKVC
jgi:hypothetical protein